MRHIPVHFILPTVQPDGSKVPGFAIAQLQGDLVDFAGGFTRSDILGGWESPEGERLTETGYRYEVSIAPGRLADFDDFLRGVAKAFEQRAIYRVVFSEGMADCLAPEEV